MRSLSRFYGKSLFCVAFLLGGCQPQNTQTPLGTTALTPQSMQTPLAQTTPTPIGRIKKVDISVARSSGGLSRIEASFPIGTNAKPDVTVYWNGYGFLVKSDSGADLGQISEHLVFRNKQWAKFTLTKKVTLIDGSSSSSIMTSQDVTVKRGVKATF